MHFSKTLNPLLESVPIWDYLGSVSLLSIQIYSEILPLLATAHETEGEGMNVFTMMSTTRG